MRKRFFERNHGKEEHREHRVAASGRTVFAYPYVIFAIAFILAPLLLIVLYSVTLPKSPVSISVGEEYTVAEVVEKLGFIGYTESGEPLVFEGYAVDGDGNETYPVNAGEYTVTENSISYVNYVSGRYEYYTVHFDTEAGIVLKIEEFSSDGSLFDEPASVKLINKDSGFVFTIRHFQKFFSSPVYIKVFIRSIYIAFVSTIICLLVGYPTAYILANMSATYRNLLSMLFVLPMWMNFLLRTYAWRNLLEKSGVINTVLNALGLPEQNLMYTQSAVILCMVYNFLPFMILPIYNNLSKLDKSLLEASHDLGANHYQTLFKVVLPNSVPGIISGITMTFIPSITAFAISKIMGGTESAMIGEIIEREFKYDYWFGSAISVIIMIMLLISMLFFSDSKEETVGGGLL